MIDKIYSSIFLFWTSIWYF